MADEYREILLKSPNLSAIALNEEIAEKAAELRAHRNLRTPDAIPVATAICSGASWFLTNDSSLDQLPEIPALVLEKLP